VQQLSETLLCYSRN